MSRQIGPINQFSYVVRDLDAAIRHWADVLQVGPFFVLEHVPYSMCRYHGAPTDIDMDVALAYSGDVQIELVHQRNDAPSIFTDFLRERGEGLQHVGVITSDLDLALEHFAGRSIEPVQDGVAENGTRFAYLDTALVPGTMLELFELPPAIERAFGKMRQTCAAWDPATGAARR
jgi:hypothetical protein